MPKIVLAMALVVLISSPTFGEEVEEVKDKLKELYVDLSAPDISATAFLGLPDERVIRPGTVKELSAEVLGVTNKSGNLNSGFAIEWSPGKALGRPTSMADYRKKLLVNNLALSVGALKDSVATRVALGVRWVLFDRTDMAADA